MEQQQPPIRVLLVDDEEIVLYSLNVILQDEAALQVIGKAKNGKDALDKAKVLQPDLILMDISMPVMDGISATRKISQLMPHIKVLILTTHAEDQYLFKAMQQGAAGYVLKNTPPDDFVTLIQAACKGYMQLGPGLGQTLTQQIWPTAVQPPQESPVSLSAPIHQLSTPLPPLQPSISAYQGMTPREKEVLTLIAEGASNREISQILHIAEKTVKNHVSRVLKRVGLRNRTQLAIWANSSGANNTLSPTASSVLET